MYMRGACAALSADIASRVLRLAASVIGNGGSACAFGATTNGDTTRRLLLQFSGGSNILGTPMFSGDDVRAVRARFQRDRLQAQGTPQSGVGDAAYAALDSHGVRGIADGIDRPPGCSVMTVLKGAAIIEASLCGSGFGTAADYPTLGDLVRHILSGLEE
jgi:hypothetical protein